MGSLPDLGKRAVLVKRAALLSKLVNFASRLLSASKIAFISEELCIGCGICVKKCPFEAIQVINLPKDLDKDTTHRYGPNAFRLHRLPVPRPGQVLGLVGTNGIGKSTALKVLAGKLKPNLGHFNNTPDCQEILTYFRGSELQNYFTRILEDNLKAVMKPQYVDHIPKAIQGNVGQALEERDERAMKAELCFDLELNQVMDRNVGELSGGELQRFAIAVATVLNADIYMFDEPSSYLDVRQRLKAAQLIRSLLRANRFYNLSNCPASNEINTENRVQMLGFSLMPARIMKTLWTSNPNYVYIYINPNGPGPHLFRYITTLPKKAQKAQVLFKQHAFLDCFFGLNPCVKYAKHTCINFCCILNLTYPILVSMQPDDIFLIDEPSAYLDSEQRIVASKVLKRFILHAKKTAFVVEHDFIMATYLADRVIVYEGKPSVDCTASSPQSLLCGMNLFLSQLDITFRRDPTNYRPRINKLDSTKDREQKSAGSYYYLDD
ncbi:ABC transporter E family member 2 [Olea europaea subsp. europaea]|uniref:ABC transporter E family member 2 n=1 Tax=Olea europaea subsp. europaea TaxID=158383 RepID=A0A8S0T4J4_OLEEU|nr:ABC transporter E family member 2 [Olea europaea subsp. europaea]